jgi:hypothetical protein
MANTFTSTATISNLTRLELEALRKADALGQGKALTVGDAALAPENFVGRGNAQAEPFLTTLSLYDDSFYGVAPPTEPGKYLASLVQLPAFQSDSAKWYGPEHLFTSSTGTANGPSSWADVNANFVVDGVQTGDLLLITERPIPNPSGSVNRFAVGVIDVVAPLAVTLSSIYAPYAGPTTLTVDTFEYSYVIIRPNALRLFAVPGSGAQGQEQTFLTVTSTSTLQSTLAPTQAQIEADRIKDLVSPNRSTLDRADAVYPTPQSSFRLEELGYRVIFYPDDGTGTGPDLTKPILTLNPVIDPAIPLADQRMTIDYKAGVVRFSCAPALGGNIKKVGGVDATTGRLNLYAIFWAMDMSATQGSVKGLWASRGKHGLPLTAAKVRWISSTPRLPYWRMGSTSSGNDLVVQALSTSEDWRTLTAFGLYDDVNSPTTPERLFLYPNSSSLPLHKRNWKFTVARSDTTDPLLSVAVEVGDRVAVTVGSSASPPVAPGIVNPDTISGAGLRDATSGISKALAKINTGEYSTVHLKRGTFFNTGTTHIPPGVTIEGEGDATIVRGSPGVGYPLFQFGPNTNQGVYTEFPTRLDYGASGQRIEGLDTVWNPSRCVWAVVWADVTSNKIYFNEFDVSGVARFASPGIDIKDDANILFSTASPNSENHTPGHYPRIDYFYESNDYVVAWVEEKTMGPDVGPGVKIQHFRVVESSDPSATNLQPTKPALTISKSFTTAYDINNLVFSNHPSIATDNASGGLYFAVNAWTYSGPFTPGYVTQFFSSALVRFYFEVSTPTPILNAQNNTGYPSLSVVSSTDVAWSGESGFQFAWSVREHPLIIGTQGNITYVSGVSPAPGDSYLTDVGVGDFSLLGVGKGSKFLWLGASIPDGKTSTIDAEKPIGWDTAKLPSYGDDGIAYDIVGGTSLYIKSGFTGQPYKPYSAFVVSFALGGGDVTIGGNVLEDLLADFISDGVQVDDYIYIKAGLNIGYYRVTSVLSLTQLEISGTFANTESGIDFLVMLGTAFRYALAPMSFVKALRSTDSFGTENSVQDVAGGGLPSNPDLYVMGQYEPDYVRVCRGEDRFLVVYQAMNTTALLAKDYMAGFQGLHNTTATDRFIYLRENQNPYREYVSTCAVPLNFSGETVDTPSYEIAVNESGFDEKKARPFDLLYRALNSRELIGSKPNFQDWKYWQRNGQNLARGVSCINWLQKWTATKSPTLIPDVTWNGEDFVVVSPTKHEIRSNVGNYRVNGGGVVVLYDATFYFGLGAQNTAAWNKAHTRPTLDVGDKIYFPANGTFATVTSVLSEHAVTLTELDSALLNLGVSTSTNHIEWVLVKARGASHGAKNLGFRVSKDGEVLASSSYMTFGDALEDDSVITSSRSSITTLMNRAGGSYRFDNSYWSPEIGPLKGSDGYSFPANIFQDFPRSSRWKADVGFRGPAPGISRGLTYLNNFEHPMVAISWGESLFGIVDREISGQAFAFKNAIVFSRQSFGPYNNALKNLKIEGNNFSSGLAIKSKQKVWTRYGDPAGSTAYFATDGYKNCFILPYRKNYQDNQRLPSLGTANPTENQAFGICAVYTDAVGLDPMVVEGPLPEVGAPSTPVYPYQETPFLSELSFQRYANNRNLWPAHPSAPKVVWDGRNFASAWFETMGQSVSSGGYLRFCLFPGDPHEKEPGEELVAPFDVGAKMSVAQQSYIQGSTLGFTVTSLATSGNTYAVAWTNGIDKGASTGENANVGVTIFSNLSGGDEETYDCDPTPYYTNTDGDTSPGYLGLTQDQDLKIGYFLSTSAPAPNYNDWITRGDILVITSGVAIGKYRVLGAQASAIWVDRPIPSANAISYAIHKSRKPVSGKNYILASSPAVKSASLDTRDDLGSPTVMWNGRQYVVSWRTKGRQFNKDTQHSPSLMFAYVPEEGFQVADNIILDSFSANSQLLLEFDAAPGRVYVTGKSITLSNSSTSIVGSTLNDTGVNFIQSGIVSGCVMIIGPATNRMVYVVQSVTTTSVVVNNPIHVAGVQPYEIYEWAAFPDIKQGDNIVISYGSYDSVSTYVPSLQQVIGINPALKRLEISEGAPATDTLTDKANLFGYIETRSVSDERFASNTGVSLNEGPKARVVGFQPTSQDALANIDRVYGVTYDQNNDTYTALVGTAGIGINWKLHIVQIDAKTLQGRRSFEVGSGVRFANMAWNGTHNLVTYIDDAGVAYPGTWEVKYATFNSSLQREESGVLTNNTDLIGSAPHQTPGDDVLNTTTSFTAPVPYNTQVQWNPKINRWVIAVSLAQFPDILATTTTGRVLPEVQLTGTVLLSAVANVLTLDDSANPGEVDLIAPGSKLVFRYDYITSIFTSQPEIIVDVLAVNYGTKEVTVSTSIDFFPRGAGGWVAGDISVVPREDIFVFTMGYNSPLVKMLDPDGLRLENISIAGMADFEERWKYLGKSHMRTTGPILGATEKLRLLKKHASVIATDTASAMQNGSYIMSIGSPSYKFKTPTVTNIRTRARSRYGFDTSFINYRSNTNVGNKQ